MSDTALRGAARGAALGDDAASARWLINRVRTGSLTTNEIALAAWAGHEGARIACGCCCNPDAPRNDCWEHSRHLQLPIGTTRWFYELGLWGYPVYVCVLIAAARAAVGEWHLIRPSHEDAMGKACLAETQQELAAVEAAEAWLIDQSEANYAVWHAKCIELEDRDGSQQWHAFANVCWTRRMAEHAGRLTLRFIECSAPRADDKQVVYEAVAAALIKWALRG